jgi:hypothetical protein
MVKQSDKGQPVSLTSREYKVMLDHLRFTEPQKAVSAFWTELKRQAETIGVEAKGALTDLQRRTISFLDTPDHSFRQNEFVLRRRKADGELQYTLKCRSPDRYIAAGAPIEASKSINAQKGVKPKQKLEEDIVPPFISRFSHSNTLTFAPGVTPSFGEIPETVEDCAAIFPVFETLIVNGRKLSGKTSVNPVNGLEAYERVFEGGTLHFHAKDDLEESVKASVALILWSLGAQGRPLVAEFSFKYKDKDEDQHFNRNMAVEAKRCFERIQTMDWILRDGRTKTAYAYGD